MWQKPNPRTLDGLLAALFYVPMLVLFMAYADWYGLSLFLLLMLPTLVVYVFGLKWKEFKPYLASGISLSANMALWWVFLQSNTDALFIYLIGMCAWSFGFFWLLITQRDWEGSNKGAFWRGFLMTGVGFALVCFASLL